MIVQDIYLPEYRWHCRIFYSVDGYWVDDTLAEARKALNERLPHDHTLQIFKGVKGSRHPKEYYVGHYIEFINIY